MARLGTIELNQLPPMQVLEDLDSETIISDRMTKFVEIWKKYDPPAGANYDVENLEFDPIRINQENNSYFELLLRDRVNQAAKAVTLAFASGDDLDAIGSRYPGGMPRLEDETDDEYRVRIWLSPNTLSPHGTYESYVFWALSADTTLRDATATAERGTPRVTITIMADGDEVTYDEDNNKISTFPSPTPTTAQIDAVTTYVKDDSRQALTDVVYVRAPKITETDYNISVWLFPGWDKTPLMTAIHQAIADLIEKQRWLGYSHVIAAIEAACMIPGVHDCKVNTPAASIDIDQHEVVVVKSVTIIYEGRGGFEEPEEP